MKRIVNTSFTPEAYEKAKVVSQKVLGQVNLAGLFKYLVTSKAEELGLNDK